jgi:aspartyl/asparaginyl-tRNA synthetase
MTDKETIDTKISETVSGTKTSSDPSTDPISLDIIDCSKEEYINKKVKIQGWINFGREGRKKKLYFCIVRDGTAYIQCVFDVKNMKDYDPAQLPNLTVRETSIELIGTLQKYPKVIKHHQLVQEQLTVKFRLNLGS